jgi:hypothetical protein
MTKTTEHETENGAPPAGGTEDLDKLAKEILADLKAERAAVKAEHEAKSVKLGRYRASGEKLLRAKEAVGHGSWRAWLRDNLPGLSERQSQKRMRYAKTPPKADLDEEEAQWREVSGGEAAAEEDEKGATGPKLAGGDRRRGRGRRRPAGEGRLHLGPFPRAELQELKRKLSDLATVMPGVSGHAGVAKCLVNREHKDRFGKGKEKRQGASSANLKLVAEETAEGEVRT